MIYFKILKFSCIYANIQYLQQYLLPLHCGGKVKSANKPPGSSGQSLSRFLQHEASTPPWIASWSIARLSPALHSPVPICSPQYSKGHVLQKNTSQGLRTARSGNENTNHEATVPPMGIFRSNGRWNPAMDASHPRLSRKTFIVT